MGKTERKRKIIESAARLFASKRFGEVLMDDVAREAGIAKGTVYSYFGDKEELYFAVVVDGISRLNEELDYQGNQRIAPEKKLRGMIRALIRFQTNNMYLFKLMHIEDSREETGPGQHRQLWETERVKQLEAIETVLQAGVEQNIFTVHHLKTEARILRDMVRSVLLNNLFSSQKKMTNSQMVEVIIRVFLRGIEKKD